MHSRSKADAQHHKTAKRQRSKDMLEGGSLDARHSSERCLDGVLCQRLGLPLHVIDEDCIHVVMLLNDLFHCDAPVGCRARSHQNIDVSVHTLYFIVFSDNKL